MEALQRLGWRIYQKSLLNLSPPHNNSLVINQIEIIHLLRKYRLAFARWTTHFDCGTPTEWWYCIKDEPVKLDSLTSKQRYRVNKGLKNTVIKRLLSNEILNYADDLYQVTVACLIEYPKKYRKIPEKQGFVADLANPERDVWICIDKTTETICGYSFCTIKDDMAYLKLVKVMPEFKKNEVNAALAYELCHYYLNDLSLRYLCDGERNIRHETHYQDFLIKTLGFRYAYCQLNIVYHPLVQWIVKMLYPFRSIVRFFGEYSPLMYNVSCVLKQEQIVRSFQSVL